MFSSAARQPQPPQHASSASSSSSPAVLHNYNILLTLRTRTLTARGLGRLRHLPDGVHKRLDRAHNRMAKTVLDLEETITLNDVRRCRASLLQLYHLLKDNNDDRKKKKDFILFGGLEALVRLLFLQEDRMREASRRTSSTPSSPPFPSRSRSSVPSTGGQLSEEECLVVDALALLRGIMYVVFEAARILSKDFGMVIYLFSLMSSSRLFNAVSSVVEELLNAREEVFDLSLIPNFQELVMNLSDRRLVFFCRVLTLVTFEEPRTAPVATGEKPLSAVEAILKKGKALSPSAQTLASNHARILEIPAILDRFVKLIGPVGRCLVNSEALSSLTTISELFLGLSQEALDDIDMTDGDLETNDTQYAFRAVALAAQLVEVLFVLASLLNGKHKTTVQKRLEKLGLVKELSVLFERMSWDSSQDSHQGVGPHGPGCECNPDSALRVQFLRVVLFFCDREFDNPINRGAFLHPEEVAAGRLFVPALATRYPSTMANSILGASGLLANFINVLVSEPIDSSNRYWITSCIEAFLRGAEPKYQLLVARTGLLRHILEQILNPRFRCSGSLQTSFDLLGELLKFNGEVLTMLDSILTTEEFNQILQVMVLNLVDSNVFLRSLVLTMEQIRSDAEGSSPFLRSRTLRQLCDFIEVNRWLLMIDLMTVITLEDISQENICCINTALVFFIFAKRRQQLPIYIQKIRSLDSSWGFATELDASEMELEEKKKRKCDRSQAVENFQSLLTFWRRYYEQMDKDRLGLEYFSGISFEEWLDTYRQLGELCGR